MSMEQRSTKRRITTQIVAALSCAAVAVCWLLLTSLAWSQQPATPSDLAEQLFPGSATLRTDTESARTLTRAEESVAVGRPDLAAALWQKLLDESGDLLVAEEV